MKGEKGQVGFTQIIVGFMIFFIILIGFVSLFNWNNGGRGDFLGPLTDSINSVSTGFMAVLGPLFKAILGLGSDTNTNFLMILTFILISIIIVGTLDSVNIFDDTRSGNLINLAVGIIVSIIGVRFMPQDIWISLTAPSSAFVATILVGAPFMALFFVTMKIKFPLARKLLWLFYIIFMSYLIFFPGVVGRDQIAPGGLDDFAWIYMIFVVLALVMLFFDSTVRRYIGREKSKLDVENQLSGMTLKQRQKLRTEISDWQEIIGDSRSPKRDIIEAKKKLRNAELLYGDLSSI